MCTLSWAAYAQEYDAPLLRSHDPSHLRLPEAFGVVPRQYTPPAFTLDGRRCDPNLANHLMRKRGYRSVTVADVWAGKVVVSGTRNGNPGTAIFADKPGCPQIR